MTSDPVPSSPVVTEKLSPAMDPLSIAASIVALLNVTENLVRYGYEFYKANEGREQEVAKLKRLEGLIDLVGRRLKAAGQEPAYRWHKVILDNLDAKRNGHSPFKRLEEVTDALEIELRSGQKTRVRDRAIRHWKKKEIDAQFAEISKCWDEISPFLHQGHYELSEAQHRIQKDQHNLLESHDNRQEDHIDISKSTNERLEKMDGRFNALIGTLSRQEEVRIQRRLKKEEDSLREAIEQWLSPLEFPARQQDFISKCFPTGLWLLESEEFTSWVKGRPWQLRCYGDTGSGKVCCEPSTYLQP